VSRAAPTKAQAPEVVLPGGPRLGKEQRIELLIILDGVQAPREAGIVKRIDVHPVEKK